MTNDNKVAATRTLLSLLALSEMFDNNVRPAGTLLSFLAQMRPPATIAW